jgi:hypothetical protein
MRSEIDMKLLERSISNLVSLYGYVKVNIEREDGSREGVWAVPISKEDEIKSRSESFEYQDTLFTCRLCNDPLGTWYGKSWGDEIKARNRGPIRPEALISDNFNEEDFDDVFR